MEFDGTLSVTGYGDTLRWAVYDPVTRLIRFPNKGSAPEKEVACNGQEFSPYWKPLSDNIYIECCQRLSEWWGNRNRLEGLNTPAVQHSQAHRRHLLLSEASPDLAPGGFFDCTVEVSKRRALVALNFNLPFQDTAKIRYPQRCDHRLCYRLHTHLFSLSFDIHLVST